MMWLGYITIGMIYESNDSNTIIIGLYSNETECCVGVFKYLLKNGYFVDDFMNDLPPNILKNIEKLNSTELAEIVDGYKLPFYENLWYFTTMPINIVK